jgi:AcrR family transcriptional regulator
MPQANPTKARKTPLQARSKLMVETILDATARVLVEEGFSRTTTNRVAERAGISVGSLYQYFPSREALVAAVAQRFSEGMKARLEQQLAKAKGGSLESALRNLLNGISETHAANPELARVLTTELPRLGDMEWREDIASRGLAIAEAVLTAHKAELRSGLEVASAAFVIAKASEAIMDGIARYGFKGAKAAGMEQALFEMVIRYLVAAEM